MNVTPDALARVQAENIIFYCLFDDFCVRTSKNTAENKPDMSSSSLSFVLVSDRSLRTSSTACSYPDSSGCLSRTCPILFV